MGNASHVEGRREITADEAAALLTAGVVPVMDAFIVEASGKRWETWFLPPVPDDAPEGSRESAALEWLEALRSDLPEAQSFPLRFAVAALENHRKLVAWQEGKSAAPGIVQPREGCPARLGIEGVPAVFTGAFRVRDLVYAAALVTLGFTPIALDFADGHIGFSGKSITFPSLDPRELLRAAEEAVTQWAGRYDAVRVDGWPPGEHPWCFAVQVQVVAENVRSVRRAGWENPSVLWKARRSTKTAIVSAAVEAEGSGFDDVKTAMRLHLR